MTLRVLVVDDTALFRRVISDVLSQLPDVEVIGTAPNGKIAIERVAALSPDLITLDIEMPEMDGLETLDVLRQRGLQCGVIIVSALTQKGGDLTIRALERGAFDFITKPEAGDQAATLTAISDALAQIIRAYRRHLEIRSILKTGDVPVAETKPVQPSLQRREIQPVHRKSDVVLVGVSTGGPNALAELLPSMPANFPVPILIVQHMPALFTHSLASSLDKKCSLKVKEAEDGEAMLAGTVYIAPGGRHMKIASGHNGGGIVQITDDAPENNCRPSVDYLFRSVANYFRGNVTAVIMTGMGSDGVLGLRLLKRRSTYVIAQDEASCVVFGMPGEAIKAGVVDAVVPLSQIAGSISRSVKSVRS